ncbi:MAG: hypothetical protein U0V18_15730 [Anaerolineales bacterium]
MTFFSFKPHTLDSKHVTLALGLAVISLGQALQHGNGYLNSTSLFFLTLSLVFLGWAFFFPTTFGDKFFAKTTFSFLLLGLLLQIFQLSFLYFGDSEFLSLLPNFWQFRIETLAAGTLAIIHLALYKKLSTKWNNVLTVLVLLILWFSGVWLIKNIPYPFIDVFVFQQNSGDALLKGVNPYTLSTPNIYGDKYIYGYGAELIQDGVLTIGNPYPPLSIYVSSLGYFLGGDVRYSHLVAFLASGALMAFFHPGRMSKLAAYLFLFMPKSFYVLEQSWTEPIVVMFFMLAVYTAVHCPRWAPIMVGLFFASKQYLIFVFPLVLWLFPLRKPFGAWLRSYANIVLAALLVTVPLALWNFPAFLWNVGEAQWYQIFRLDALSYLAAYARVTDVQPSQLVAFVLLGLAFFMAWYFIPQTPEGFSSAFAWCLILFFAFNKQAFCNYYFLVIGALCATLAMLSSKLSSNLLKQEVSVV